jgi:hypothetical protein
LNGMCDLNNATESVTLTVFVWLSGVQV